MNKVNVWFDNGAFRSYIYDEKEETNEFIKYIKTDDRCKPVGQFVVRKAHAICSEYRFGVDEEPTIIEVPMKSKFKFWR